MQNLCVHLDHERRLPLVDHPSADAEPNDLNVRTRPQGGGTHIRIEEEWLDREPQPLLVELRVEEDLRGCSGGGGRRAARAARVRGVSAVQQWWATGQADEGGMAERCLLARQAGSQHAARNMLQATGCAQSLGNAQIS